MGRIDGQTCWSIDHRVLNCILRLVQVTDYAYGGVDFRGDPNLALLDVAQWGAIGKNVLTMFFFIFIRFIQFFCVLISFQD